MQSFCIALSGLKLAKSALNRVKNVAYGPIFQPLDFPQTIIVNFDDPRGAFTTIFFSLIKPICNYWKKKVSYFQTQLSSTVAYPASI